MYFRKFLISCLFLFPVLAYADQEPRLFSNVPDKSQMTYHLVHKLHKVEGVAKKNILAKAKITDAQAQVVVRVPVIEFDSNNKNRDQHMAEVTDAHHFPNVDLKGVIAMAVPKTFPADVKGTLRGQLAFHGVTHDTEVPVTLHFASAKEVHATTTFPVSLDAYQVERPSLFLVKIDDRIDIDVDLTLTAE